MGASRLHDEATPVWQVLNSAFDNLTVASDLTDLTSIRPQKSAKALKDETVFSIDYEHAVNLWVVGSRSAWGAKESRVLGDLTLPDNPFDRLHRIGKVPELFPDPDAARHGHCLVEY